MHYVLPVDGREWILRLSSKVARGHMVLLKFALDVAPFMIDTGGYFILEHPTGASSWRLPDVQALIAMPSAYLVTFHQCRFNLRGRPLVVCQYGKAQGPKAFDKFFHCCFCL